MSTIVHFDIPADMPERARTFYAGLFGWKFNGVQGIDDFFLIETEQADGSPGVGGGLGRRGAPEQRITMYVGVPSVDETSRQVQQLGGAVVLEKMPVPGWGYLAVCTDTEGNTFGIWEENAGAR